MTVEINPPFRVFTDVDGEPLEDGYIYVGAVSQNPQAVPISVFWDQALTIPAAQPIRTLGGYPSRTGTPSRMYVAGDAYSISVLNKNSTLIYSDLDNRAGDAGLRQDLANNTDLAKGAGLSGFDNSLLYAANTVGAALKNNIASANYTSIFTFLNDAEIADVSSFTGSINITVKVQSALDSGKSLFFPPGVYLASPLYLPHNGELNGVGNPDGTLRGNCLVGTNQTIMKQVDSTKLVLGKTEENGRLYNWTIGPFVFMPTAAGSTAPALDLSGMTFCTINQIRGVSNGAFGFPSLIRLNSSPVPGLPGGDTRQCHGNTINDPTIEGVVGYTKCIEFDDGGLGTLYNANANTINTPKIFNCGTALLIGIDAEKSYGVDINGPVIELCPNAVGIVPGEMTIVSGGAIETMSAPFEYKAGSSRSLVNGTSITNNGTNNINFHTDARSNTWNLVNDKTGHTWVGGETRGNKKNTAVRFSAGAIPSGVAITRVSGATGTVTAVTAVTIEPWTAADSTVAYRMTSTFAATSTGVVRMNVAAPANPTFGTFKRISQEFGVNDAASASYAVSPASDSDYIFSATSGVTYTMYIVVRFKLVHSDADT